MRECVDRTLAFSQGCLFTRRHVFALNLRFDGGKYAGLFIGCERFKKKKRVKAPLIVV